MMKVAALRAVDRWIGLPACVLLTWHRRLLPRRRERAPIRRILVFKLAEQGSTVLAADAIARAVGLVGRDNVFFLVFDENRFILDAMGVIPADNVIALNVRTLRTAVQSVLVAVRRLRALRVDATVDLEFFARSTAAFAYLSGATRRVGLHSYAGEGPYRGDLLTHRLVFNPYLHTSELFRLMVDALEHPAGQFPAFPARPPARSSAASIQYVPPAQDLDAVRKLVLARTGLTRLPPIVLLNPNASDLLPLRRWDRSRYVALARRLLAASDEIYVLLTGGSDEVPEVARIVAEVSSLRCASVAGQTTMSQLLALYSLARVLVTNDSGPAHFATLTPVEVVTLFGPETPALFAARTPRNHVLRAGLACSPCVSALNNRTSRCRDNVCMQAITVDEVFAVTMQAYAASSQTASS
jgi:ADP-heptose:LPS heptosyltransferase